MAARLVKMLGSGLRLHCPRCGIGKLYAKPFKMYDRCPNCNLKFEREQGYFIGAMYINYAATGMTINQQLALWVPFAVLFPLFFFHHARSLWLVLDHFFNPSEPLYPVPPKQFRKQ